MAEAPNICLAPLAQMASIQIRSSRECGDDRLESFGGDGDADHQAG